MGQSIQVSKICSVRISAPAVPSWPSRLRVQRCRCSSSGRCCGSGLIPGPGTSTCHRHSPSIPQKKKKRKKKKISPISTLSELFYVEAWSTCGLDGTSEQVSAQEMDNPLRNTAWPWPCRLPLQPDIFLAPWEPGLFLLPQIKRPQCSRFLGSEGTFVLSQSRRKWVHQSPLALKGLCERPLVSVPTFTHEIYKPGLLSFHFVAF